MKRNFSSTLGAFCFSKCLTSFYFFHMILDKYHPQKINKNLTQVLHSHQPWALCIVLLEEA